jgi:hypothetical protein
VRPRPRSSNRGALAWALAAVATTTLVAACRKTPPTPSEPEPASPTGSASTAASANAHRAAGAPPLALGGASSAASAASAASAPPGKAAASASVARQIAKGKSPFVLDKKLDDIATGSLGQLSSLGVIVRTKSDELLLARLVPKATTIAADGKFFSRTKTLVLDRPSGAAVYWVSDHNLVRRLVGVDGKVGNLEVLASDASDGYAPRGARTSGGSPDEQQDLVLYVAQKKSNDGDRRARFWLERKGLHDLSEEGGGASSLTLTALGPARERRFVAAWLDARSALAPLHGRAITLDGAGEAQLGAENIPWIAPPSENFMELSAVRADKNVVAMVAVGKNAVDFGLATAPVALTGAPRDEAIWLDYANGVEPPVVVTGRLCGQPTLAFVEPTARGLDAPHIATLATVDDDGHVTRHLEAARGKRIDHLDLWVNDDETSPKFGEGALLAALDGRTVVRAIHCKK